MVYDTSSSQHRPEYWLKKEEKKKEAELLPKHNFPNPLRIPCQSQLCSCFVFHPLLETEAVRATNNAAHGVTQFHFFLFLPCSPHPRFGHEVKFAQMRGYCTRVFRLPNPSPLLRLQFLSSVQRFEVKQRRERWNER